MFKHLLSVLSVLFMGATVRVKCHKCGALIDVTSTEKPLRVKCPKCGAIGMLRQPAPQPSPPSYPPPYFPPAPSSYQPSPKKDKKIVVLVVVIVVILAFLFLTVFVLAPLMYVWTSGLGPVGGTHPVISASITTSNDSANITTWQIISVSTMDTKFEDLSWRLEKENGGGLLNAVKKSSANFSDENLKNDNVYRLYFLDVDGGGYVTVGDSFKVKAPSDGDYKLTIICKASGSVVFQSDFQHY